MKPLSVVTYFKTTTSDLRRQQTVDSFGLDQLPCCERHGMNALSQIIRIWTRLVACPHARMPERFATRNDTPQPALDSLHWLKMLKNASSSITHFVASFLYCCM